MKIAVVHNFYQQPGGEDQVFRAEVDLLESRGHQVIQITAHNDDVYVLSKASLARATIWNSHQYQSLRERFAVDQPAVVHVHNTLPLISPAVYYAAKEAGAAVVQTLHNYRFSCLNGLFYRDGHVCQDCLGKSVPWPGVVHACYRGSRSASTVVAAMNVYHRLRGTYRDEVDRYIALTEFSRDKFVEMGLPAAKLTVKPNFVSPDPGVGGDHRGYALFVGRLSEEKGVQVALEAWHLLDGAMPLKIVGDGPLASTVVSSSIKGVEYLGPRQRDDVLGLMRGARLLVFPSLWFETFGMTIAESFATGTPVVASRIGTAATLVEHGRTGLHFEAGDAHDLARQVAWAVANPEALAKMGAEARVEFVANYSAAANYERLMAIYDEAVRQDSTASWSS